MKTNYYQRSTVPEAFVTKGRQRLKQHGKNVYLKNGEQFEIELFNPISSKILAKIKINGKYISDSGIVLRPGERVFLERYLNESKKFLFETYHINANDSTALQAIEENGNLEVEFFEETRITTTSGITTSTYIYPQNIFYNTTNDYSENIYTTHSAKMKENVKTSTNLDISMARCFSTNPIESLEIPIETGRIEKGDNSNQSFNTDYTTFNCWVSWRSNWKILPISQQPIMKENLVIYCSNCGAKRKKSSHIFCPHCGNKF